MIGCGRIWKHGVTTDTPATTPLWPTLKRNYALGSVLIGSLSMLVAGLVAAVLGGDGQSIGIIAGAMITGMGVSLAPVIVGVKQEFFGVSVLAAGGARMLIVLAIVMIAAMTLGLENRPIGLGAGAGLLLNLIAETVLAMAILSRVDRKTELA